MSLFIRGITKCECLGIIGYYVEKEKRRTALKKSERCLWFNVPALPAFIESNGVKLFFFFCSTVLKTLITHCIVQASLSVFSGGFYLLAAGSAQTPFQQATHFLRNHMKTAHMLALNELKQGDKYRYKVFAD